jgi:hypothetical protein
LLQKKDKRASTYIDESQEKDTEDTRPKQDGIYRPVEVIGKATAALPLAKPFEDLAQPARPAAALPTRTTVAAAMPDATARPTATRDPYTLLTTGPGTTG